MIWHLWHSNLHTGRPPAASSREEAVKSDWLTDSAHSASETTFVTSRMLACDMLTVQVDEWMLQTDTTACAWQRCLRVSPVTKSRIWVTACERCRMHEGLAATAALPSCQQLVEAFGLFCTSPHPCSPEARSDPVAVSCCCKCAASSNHGARWCTSLACHGVYLPRMACLQRLKATVQLHTITSSHSPTFR